ncbi:hypothetical protein [Arachidicoccus soli]|uniref:Glycoside-hydrolase family GH114 TIM-barrel domain-containing protein n=1 Tax=Arachidicoccus soli TaxID=2341117 RepID=A0A386HPY5_9BACT|nr:hypothetical protein [Arachidicoccus soli]AYD47324.1 hypothetical protein D6B99_06685 [Arachidicoccus soli]
MKHIIKACMLPLLVSVLALSSCEIKPITTMLEPPHDSTSTDSASTAVNLTVKHLKALCVYYGWPSDVNGSNGDITKATSAFQQFDLIVLGDGLWKTTNGDHANTISIISNLNTAGKAVYGYTDLGVSTQNLSIADMKTAVDGWAGMGVKGIFWDDAGYDYNTTRARQDTMINYCHQKGLSVMMNAWNPDDVLAGTDMLLDSSDIYVLESYLISANKYTSLSTWKSKANKCAAYEASLGVKMACLSSGDSTISASYNKTDQFTQAWVGAAIYNFDYFQVTDNMYSANNNTVYYYPNISDSYGTKWNSVAISDSASINYNRSTESWTLHVRGDGSTWGYGGFSQP